MAWSTLTPEWGNSWGSQMLTSSSLIRFPKCLGKVEGRRLRIWLKHSLDGLLHWTRATREACCSLHKALFPHPIPSYTALESSYSWGCLLTCPVKRTTTLCWEFLLDKVGKKLPSFWCNKHRDWEALPALQCWIFKGGSCGGRDLCGEKNLEIGSWVELTTTAECITQDSSWAIDR